MTNTALPGTPAPVIPIGTRSTNAARPVGSPVASPASAASSDPRALQLVPASTALAVPAVAVVQVNLIDCMHNHPRWSLLGRLPIRLSAEIPLPGFKVRDLLALRAGHIVDSAWDSTTDVLLKAGEAPVCWLEFEVVEHNMAVRITRLV